MYLRDYRHSEFCPNWMELGSAATLVPSGDVEHFSVVALAASTTHNHRLTSRQSRPALLTSS